MPLAVTTVGVAIDRVGASAMAATFTGSWAVVEPPASVAVTVRLKSTPLFFGGVNFRLTSCAIVSDHTPSPRLVPAESVAPAGTPEIVIDTPWAL